MRRENFMIKLSGLILVSFLLQGYVLIASAPSLSSNEDCPKPEHPNPQFYRENWLNLNGRWGFSFDFDLSGVEKGWHENGSGFEKEIVVPFCPESELSGIGYTNFMPAVWYHRKFTVPDSWAGTRVFLHFGAVEYDCRAWINGELVGRHHGGNASFEFEITSALKEGENDIVVCAVDDIRSGDQPSGKQSKKAESYSIFYTRVTGIWQTVWLESRPHRYLESVRVVPDLDNSRFVVTPVIENYKQGLVFKATLMTSDGEEVAVAKSNAVNGAASILDVKDATPWSPDNPYLYKLKFELLEGDNVIDLVSSYSGLRKIHIEGNKLYLNNKPLFLRFVLNQGYYPDGIWTAPNDQEHKADIERAMAIGFNGARLHQKVFEKRFHYWADKMGFLTWGEFYDWEIPAENHAGMSNIKREWYEVVHRDVNHPSIIAWVPYNERTDVSEVNRVVVQETVDMTRILDPTRPVNDASGYIHVDTDLFTVHDYDQDLNAFIARYDSLSPEKNTAFICHPEASQPYSGQPYIVDEYGGAFWSTEYPFMQPINSGRLIDWGKGKTAEEMEEHIASLTKTLLDNPNISGFSYTQLTDVEQEINGLYTYDRKLKFNAKRLKAIFEAPAAIEKEK
jgi:beta-galactosidase/beta-glucuronidase